MGKGQGYPASEIGAYVMVGLPGQRIEEVEDTVRYALALGVRPYLAEYSPVPGTVLWPEAVEASPFPLADEPLFHNNSLLPCRWEGLPYEALLRLKSSLNQALANRRGLLGLQTEDRMSGDGSIARGWR